MSRVETEIAVHAAATRDSFRATLAFGRLALAMLFLAGLIGWAFGDLTRGPFLWAIVATAAAYVAQLLYTVDRPLPCAMLQVVSLGCAVFSFLSLAV